MRSRWVTGKFVGAGLLALSGVAAMAVVPSWASGGAQVPADSHVPGRTVGGYWSAEGVGGALKVSEVTAGAPQYNLMYVGFAYRHPGDAGVAFYPPGSQSELQADIAASRNAGTRWLLSVGGDNGNISLKSEEDATTLVAALTSIVDTYHFDGVDFDIECSGETCWDEGSLKSAAHQLKQHYRDRQFLISAAPAPWSDKYRNWAKSMGAELDLFGYQFYDDAVYNTADGIRAQVVGAVNKALAADIAPCKILVGAKTHQGDGKRPSEIVPDYINAVVEGDRAVEKYFADNPGPTAFARDCAQRELGGAFVWNANYDRQDDWTFAKQMGEAMRRS